MQPNNIEITSLQNPLVKLARSLDRKKERKENNAFRAEGMRHIIEGLNQGWKLQILFVSTTAKSRPQVKDLINKLASTETNIVYVKDSVLQSIANRDNAQNLLGVFEQKWYQLSDFESSNFILALERPKDPGNMGTIIRTLDSIGQNCLVLLEDACDPYSTEAIRAAMGSSFSVKIARATIDEFDDFRKKNNYSLYGTYLKGASNHIDIKFNPKSILLMGNEQSGIDEDLANLCDNLIKLPMSGNADSLNLSVATGICLYEYWRQNNFDGARK